MTSQIWVNLAYLVAAVFFIAGLKGLSHPRTAVRGNLIGALGMFIAIVVTLVDQQLLNWVYIVAGIAAGSVIGAVLAIRIQMTAMPQLVGLFNGFGGGASILVAGAVLNNVDLERAYHKDYYYAGYYFDDGEKKPRKKRGVEPEARVG